jgi:hypothetical protein
MDYIFLIPDEQNMWAYQVDTKWQILITNWGAVYNNNDERKDILSELINKPRLLTCDVTFRLIDQKGNPKINFKFDLSYLNKEIELITDTNGMHYFGACKIGSEYKFYAHINNKKRLLAALTFKQNGVYDIIVTDYSDITLKVLDQNKTPIIDEEFNIEFLGSSQNYMTDKEGLIYFSDFPVGNTLLVTDNIDKNNCAEYTVEADSSIFEFFVISQNSLKLPKWIRLGKWMSKAEVKMEQTQVKIKTGNFTCTYPLNPLDVMFTNQVISYDVINMPPVSLIRNVILNGEYYEGLNLPVNMAYRFS